MEESEPPQSPSFLDDARSYPIKEVQNYRDIIIRQIDLCRVELSKNLTEGGTFFTKYRGATIPKVVPDQWIVNERVVNQLYDLMLYSFDDTMKDELESMDAIYSKEKRNIYEKYLKMEVDMKKKDIAIKYGGLVTSTNSSITVAEKMAISDMRNIMDWKTRELYRQLCLCFKRNNDLSDDYTIKYTKTNVY